MHTTNCPSCESPLAARGNFCPNCGSQARCSNFSCRDVLERNARACVTCGTLVGNAPNDGTINGALSERTANRIRYSESDRRKQLEASLSDQAVESLGGTLGAMIGMRALEGRRFPTSREFADDEPNSHPADDLLDEVQLAALPSAKPAETELHTDRELLARVFRQNGDRLRLDETRLKGSTKIDTQVRATYLYLYIRLLDGHEKVKRADLYDMLRDASLYDPNIVSRINTAPELVAEGDNVLLRLPGRERASQVLAEVFDTAVSNGWTVGTTRRTRRSKGGEAESPNEAAAPPVRRKDASRISTKTVDEWVAAWKAKEPSVNGHDLIKGRPNVEKGLFGLWAIRCAAGETGKVVTRRALAGFLYKAFEVQVDDRSLQNVLSSDAKKGDRVLEVEGTRYQITPTGMAHVELFARPASRHL